MSEVPDLHRAVHGLEGAAGGSSWRPLVSPRSIRPGPPGSAALRSAPPTRAHKPPVKSCGCGIYAVKTFDDLKEHRYNVDGQTIAGFIEKEMVWVVARVALWGEVAEGRIGYRAQYAYPKKIYVPADKLKLAALIRERYGVKVGDHRPLHRKESVMNIEEEKSSPITTVETGRGHPVPTKEPAPVKVPKREKVPANA